MPRDPARIEPMLELLRQYWTLSPDLRLAQIIVNCCRPCDPCPQVFYREDDVVAERLRESLDRIAGRRVPADDADAPIIV